MKNQILDLYNKKPSSYGEAERELFNGFLEALNQGKIRSCDYLEGSWVVNAWVKMGILIGFRMGVLTELPWSDKKPFFDKDTFVERQFSLTDQVRIVPGGSSARNGCYIAPGVTIMPPSFINVGAYIDSGSMVDSHALVGSCAQVGKNVHLSAGAMIGGVLEPINSRPVVIEDEAFVGGNCGIYEGVLIKRKAVLASGTILTGSTPVYDAVRSLYLDRDAGGSFAIPENAVVVPGSRAMTQHPGFQIYCPIIIKYRDSKTDISVQLERDLRAEID